MLKNPGLGEIAAHYPDALEMAVFFSQEFGQAYQLHSNEHEIGYIALYFWVALERKKMGERQSNQKVVIICATGIGGSQLLAVKIRRHFPKLEILGIYPSYRLPEAIKMKPDLIISANPLHDVEYPAVHISHVLNDDDLQNIKKALDDVTPKKANLNSLFRPDLFFPKINLNDKDDVIHYLCKKN